MPILKTAFFLLTCMLLIFSGLVIYSTVQANPLDKSQQLRMQHLLAP